MKRFSVYIILSLILCLPLLTQAQLYDSLRSSLTMKRTIHFKFDSRNSFISSRRAQIWGVKLGADFGKKLRLGFGYNFLNSDFSKDLYYPSLLGYDTISRKLKIHYACAYIEYVFYRQNHWEFSIPVQLSIGKIWYNYNFKGVEDLRSPKHLLVLYEPSLSGQYKIFNWLGVGLGLGFRYALIKNKFIDEKLTSPVYVFKVLIYWGELYKKAFPNHPIEDLKKKLF